MFRYCFRLLNHKKTKCSISYPKGPTAFRPPFIETDLHGYSRQPTWNAAEAWFWCPILKNNMKEDKKDAQAQPAANNSEPAATNDPITGTQETGQPDEAQDNGDYVVSTLR